MPLSFMLQKGLIDPKINVSCTKTSKWKETNIFWKHLPLFQSPYKYSWGLNEENAPPDK